MKLTYIWINADKPEEQLEIPFYAVGQQDDVSKHMVQDLHMRNDIFNEILQYPN